MWINKTYSFFFYFGQIHFKSPSIFFKINLFCKSMSDAGAESFVPNLFTIFWRKIGICQNVSYFIVSIVHPCISTCIKRVHVKKRINVLIHEKKFICLPHFIWKKDSAKLMNMKRHLSGVVQDLFGLYFLHIGK